MIGVQNKSTLSDVTQVHRSDRTDAATAADGTDDGTDEPVDLRKLDRQWCCPLARAVAHRTALSRPGPQPMGLTHPQYLVMLALWERAPLSVKELAGLLALDPGTLSPLLKRLESAGLVVRRRSAEDERVLAVTLTEEGTALRARAEQVPPAIIARLGMPLSELESLHASLTSVIATARP